MNGQMTLRELAVSTPIVYVAHPLGGDIDANAARAERWIAWLMQHDTKHAFLCPWLPFVRAFRLLGNDGDDHGHPFRERCMRDNMACALLGLDGIVLVGGRCSPGMSVEMDSVIFTGGWVSDLTHFGDEPPTDAWIRENYYNPELDLVPGVIEIGQAKWEA